MNSHLDRSEAKWSDLRVRLHLRIRQLSPRTRMPQLRPSVALRWAFAAALLVAPGPHIHAQGCAQCLDSTRATPPQVQSAYRHAIFLLGGCGAALFIAGAALLRRHD